MNVRYGAQISVSRAGPYGTAAAKNGPSGSAYITYRWPQDARRCIETVHGAVWEGALAPLTCWRAQGIPWLCTCVIGTCTFRLKQHGLCTCKIGTCCFGGGRSSMRLCRGANQGLICVSLGAAIA